MSFLSVTLIRLEIKKYKYTFCNICEEESAVDLGDERYTIFLSTRGENPQEVSESLVNF